MKKPPGGLAASGQVQTRIADGGVVIPGASGIGIRPGKIAQGRALGMIEGQAGVGTWYRGSWRMVSLNNDERHRRRRCAGDGQPGAWPG